MNHRTGKSNRGAAGWLCGLLLVSVLAGCRGNLATPLEQAESDWQTGDCAAAARGYESLLQKAGSGAQSVKLHFDLANVYYLCPHKAQRNLDRAQEHYRFVAEQSTDPALAVTSWRRVAQILADNNRRNEAIAEYENLLKRYPDTTERRSIRLEI